MSEEMEGNSARRRRPRGGALAWAALAGLGLVLYLHSVPENPPGFFADESSIAYNAHLVARHGADEHGARFPLFFRAFGEYKSPVYVYLLAALFKLTGPSIAVARSLSAVLGAAAALLLGLVAARSVSVRPRAVGLTVAVSALLTPWLFELSRLVFEVALMPLVLALLLLALRSAHERGRWTFGDNVRVALALALITYTYSVGRLLAPLLALGLLLFAGRGRWWSVAFRTWLLYAVTLLPLLVFFVEQPGALGERFAQVSFIKPGMSWMEVALRFCQNYAGHFSPRGWLVAGDPEPRHHVQTMGSLLAPTVVAAAAGLVLLLRRRGADAWWRFVVYGLLVSALPSALTLDHFHTLRLVGVPVFLLLLTAPALERLLTPGAHTRARRVVFAALLLTTLLQGALFQWHFRQAAPARWHSFDAHYPEVFAAAMSRPERPVHLIDNNGAPGYIHAYWYATLAGTDPARAFLRLPKEARPPAGALVISTELPCHNCRIISERAAFRAYIAE
ncbi:MAG TPA: glycosyltransferase family 39 protein [Pyrinomonadaceae bacterium]